MHRRPSLVLVAVFTLLGFLLVTSARATRSGREAAEPRKAELIRLIQQRRSQVADLDQAVRELRSDVGVAQRQASERNQRDEDLARRVEELSRAAGTTALQGRGLVVRLSDSDQKGTDPDHAEAYRVQDADLQLVVNALFDAGAEAVAVNGSRLVATTPIRSAGGTIVVNFRPLNPPYVVEAIGPNRGRFEASDIAKRFSRWQKLFGLGFSVRDATVTVPSYTGRVGITSAKPAGGEGS